MLLGRDAHKSVVAGLIFSGLQPRWVRPRWDGQLHLSHPPSPEAFEEAWQTRGSVRIEVPKAFTVDVSGSEMTRSTRDDGTQVFRAETPSPLSWFAWVNARNDDGLTRERLQLGNGEAVLVRGWPEDTRWRKRVAAILSDGIPELTRRIGLPWPVDGSLSVLEIHTPLLDFTKADIAAEAARLGIDAGLSWSCYDPAPGGLHCGLCDSCRLRSKGFAEAGLPDPTRYAATP